jgi:capsular polysaccharide biosynthesis protein
VILGKYLKTRSSAEALETRSLDEIGLQYGIDQASDGHNYLDAYQREIDALRINLKDIAIISGTNSLAIANAFADYLPSVNIHLLAVRGISLGIGTVVPPNVFLYEAATLADRHRVLRDISSPQIIVDDGLNLKSDKRKSFRELFFYLEEGGLYIVEDLHASYISELVDDEHENIEQVFNRLRSVKSKGSNGVGEDDIELSESMTRVVNYGKIAFIEKNNKHLLKLRDRETNSLLNRESCSLKGNVLSIVPSRSFESKATLTTNRPDLQDRLLKKHIAIPEMSLREYFDVECFPGQVARSGKFLLPDTFRHPEEWRLKNKQIVDATHRFARVSQSESRPVDLIGEFYYLDTEYPGHFGHITSEVISRLAGWRQARKRYPGIKALVSLAHDSTDLPEFQWQIFDAFGISRSDVVVIESDQWARVPTLVAATPLFANPLWAAPEIKEIWDHLGSRLRASARIHPEKIFVSRRNERIRKCRNVGLLEKLFESYGFHVLFPEDYPFGEQVDIFASAKSIGGFGGSGMFNMMFAESPGDRYVVTSESYTAVNEYLISSVCGDNINYFWEKADIVHPKNGWTWNAFFSDFEFDMHSSGYRLQRLLESS